MWLTDLLTDKRTDRRTDKRVAGGHYCWGVLLWPPQLGLGGKCDKKWKFKNVEKSHHFLTLWPWPLTYDLEKLIRSGHYHYQCVYQIWEQSIPWFLSYRVNTIASGGWLRRKTITSPDPSDTGDIIIYQSSASLAFVQGIHQWPVNSLHKRPVMPKMCPFDDVTNVINLLFCHQYFHSQIPESQITLSATHYQMINLEFACPWSHAHIYDC